MSFKLSVEELTSIFDPDHIRNGEALETLKGWGKIEGL